MSDEKPKVNAAKSKKAEAQPTATEEITAPVEAQTATPDPGVAADLVEASVVETSAVEPAETSAVETATEESKPPAQVIAVSGIAELLSGLVTSPDVEAQELAESDADLRTKQSEFENWCWNNRSATVEEKEAARKAILG